MDIELKSFPKNRYEALAMLYLENQDLSNLTPEQLFDKYIEVYEAIKDHSNKNRKNDIIAQY